ncbi:hypothetical protein ACFX19_041119 [Malus domestica]
MYTSTALEASCPSSPSSPTTSSSSSLEDEIYDVFLSFSEDTRKTFTDHLYWKLKAARLDTFIDENESMRREEAISDKVKRAIRGSRIAVIIFSRRYADSIRCLEELVKIMECKRTMEQMVLPIFYDVDPSDVKNQSGTFAKAFKKHENHFHQVKDKDEKLWLWRNALTEAADLAGEDFAKTDGYEGEFIRKIIDGITRILKNTSLGVATGQEGNLMMHDMIRDMGREIGLAESSGNPEERSRLRVPEDVAGVLRNNSGTRKIIGLSLDSHESDKPGCSTESFQKMQILRALKLTGSCMHHSTLAGSPDFLEIIKLEKLILKGLPDLSEIHYSAAHLFNLNYLSPDLLMELIIDDCKSLSKFLPSTVQQKNLKHLSLVNCKLTNDAIPKDLGGLSSLEVLDLRGNAFSRPPSLSGLSKLQVLHLGNCKNLGALPDLPKKSKILKANEFMALKKKAVRWADKEQFREGKSADREQKKLEEAAEENEFMALEKKPVRRADKEQLREGESADDEQKKLEEEAFMALEKKAVRRADKGQFKEGESADEEQKKLNEEAADKNEFMALERKAVRRADIRQFMEGHIFAHPVSLYRRTVLSKKKRTILGYSLASAKKIDCTVAQ